MQFTSNRRQTLAQWSLGIQVPGYGKKSKNQKSQKSKKKSKKVTKSQKSQKSQKK